MAEQLNLLIMNDISIGIKWWMIEIEQCKAHSLRVITDKVFG